MAKRNDILTSIHGRQIGINSDDELVVHGKVLPGLGFDLQGNTFDTSIGGGFSDAKRTAPYAAETQSTFGAGDNKIRSFYGKVEVDAIPVRARVCVRSAAVDLNPAHWDFAVAMTEVFTDTTDVEKFSPVVGGVEYNAAPSGGTPYGWIVGNLASAGGVNGTTHETTGDAQKMVVACGPWVTLPFVPRADGDKGAVVLFRAVHTNTGSFFSSKKPGDVSAGSDGSTFKTRKFWLRASADNVNGITTFTNVPSAATTNASSADVYLEFEFAQPVRSVWGVGDSVTANWEYAGWFMQAVWAASKPEAPLIPFLHARSGSAMSTYIGNFLNYSAVTGSVPTDLVIPCFSPNSTHASDANMLADRQLLEEVLIWARDRGVRVFLWDGCPVNTYVTTQQARLDAQRAWAKAKVAEGSAFRYIEMARAVTLTYGVPSGEDFITGLNLDTLHPNPAGAAVMAVVQSVGLIIT